MRAISSTYRVQLRPEFGFDDAAAVVDYLAQLGVSHLYCSPYLQAAPGSAHGYDVVDHSRVNAELGGEDAHARLLAALDAHGLGHVLDIVPNHMAIAEQNRWWWDVLEHGPASRFATHFDVDWDPPEARLRDTVLIPVLGTQYGRALEAGEVRLAFEDRWFTVRYFEHRFPAAPRSLAELFLVAAGAADSADLAFLGSSLARLPHATATDRVSVHERSRDTAVIRRAFARLCADAPAVVEEVAAAVDALNADPDALDALLERQNYRLAHWKAAGQDLDYRRFFDIATLVALRVEDETVFADTHRLVLSWVRAGVLDGLRVDHVDGLRDPEGYLRRLDAAAPGAWVVVEKILEGDEGLPESWPVAGTTGYDALTMVGGLFVDQAAEPAFTNLYSSLTGDDRPFDEVAYEAKHHVLRAVLAADVNRLTNLLVDVAEHHRRYRDYTRHDWRDALREMLACFPVYRTYASDADTVAAVAKTVGERRPDLDADLLAFLAQVLDGSERGVLEDELRSRFRQLSGPVMAKGVEDTAFYRYQRFLALNEVGGDPGRFGVGVDEFHHWAAHTADRWPRTMTTLSTHDTKRSEDVRARLYAVSEVPDEWAAFARAWVDAAIDVATQYLMLQTVVGAWPLSFERAWAFAEKAVREAKQATSWTEPDAAYEATVRRWLEERYASPSFTAAVDGFVALVAPAGRVNSVAQKLVQLTMPGIPDVYQGCELEDLSLVDPDNRRPVDYGRRRDLLALDDAALAGVEPKLVVVRAALAARYRHRLDDAAPYEPVAAGQRTLAFRRGEDLVTAVPVRGMHPAVEVSLPPGEWRDLLPDLPVSLYERARQ